MKLTPMMKTYEYTMDQSDFGCNMNMTADQIGAIENSETMDITTKQYQLQCVSIGIALTVLALIAYNTIKGRG